MVTILDVAKKAKTSIATVSRVLNNQTGYSEKTRKKVLKVVDELGYEYNAIARSLKLNKTNTIGVIVPNISSMVTHDLLDGIEEASSAKGYSVIVSYTYSNIERKKKILKNFKEQRVDGLLFVSDYLDDDDYLYLKNMDIPVVLVSTISEKYSLPYVKTDDYAAAYGAVEFLISKGHQEIGMLSGDANDLISGITRLNGYKACLKNANLLVEERKIAYGTNYSFDDGKNKLKELLASYPEMTALFVASDEMAAGVIAAAHEMGIKIPEELSIIGYDNILISQMVWPAMTTVSQPLMEMGSKATDMVLKLINGEIVDAEPVILPYEIIERASVCQLN